MFTDKNMLKLNPKHFKNNRIIHPDFKNKQGMIIIVADWCGYCKMAKEPWIQFRKIAKNHFIIASLNAVKYPKTAKKLGVQGYPTILSINNQGKYVQYTGQRDIFTLTSELCNKVSNHPICKK